MYISMIEEELDMTDAMYRNDLNELCIIFHIYL